MYKKPQVNKKFYKPVENVVIGIKNMKEQMQKWNNKYYVLKML
jgi:hypothetical protein